MRRRDFIRAIFGSATAWPLAARTQQPGKLPTIGFLGTDAEFWRQWVDAFTARLRELGWIEGRTVAIEYRWSEGRPERSAEIAAEFVRLKVDVIVTNGVSASTLKRATSVIPIVFALGPDPVGSGLVTNLAKPGGNVTGLSVQSAELQECRTLARGCPPSAPAGNHRQCWLRPSSGGDGQRRVCGAHTRH